MRNKVNKVNSGRNEVKLCNDYVNKKPITEGQQLALCNTHMQCVRVIQWRLGIIQKDI
jgi:hypothetical protein